MPFPTDELNLYLMNDAQAFLIGTDSGEVLLRSALKQE